MGKTKSCLNMTFIIIRSGQQLYSTFITIYSQANDLIIMLCLQGQLLPCTIDTEVADFNRLKLAFCNLYKYQTHHSSWNIYLIQALRISAGYQTTSLLLTHAFCGNFLTRQSVETGFIIVGFPRDTGFLGLLLYKIKAQHFSSLPQHPEPKVFKLFNCRFEV